MWTFVAALFRPRREPGLARIARAVEGLDPVTRAVFLLHRIDGLAYGEIAERLSITVGEVELRMAIAIGRIGACLD